MSDEIDNNDSVMSRKTASSKRSLYTRCSHCHEFYRMEPGTPCPNRKCTGTMI